jgi:hypothetical protein
MFDYSHCPNNIFNFKGFGNGFLRAKTRALEKRLWNVKVKVNDNTCPHILGLHVLGFHVLFLHVK